jgi:hypothetical protein
VELEKPELRWESCTSNVAILDGVRWISLRLGTRLHMSVSPTGWCEVADPELGGRALHADMVTHDVMGWRSLSWWRSGLKGYSLIMEWAGGHLSWIGGRYMVVSLFRTV